MLQEDAGISNSSSSMSQLPVLSRVCPSTRIEIVLKCCVCVSVWTPQKLTDASQTRQRTSKYVPDMRTRLSCLSTKMIFDHLLKTQLKKKPNSFPLRSLRGRWMWKRLNCTHRLGCGLWRHAFFADGQFECVLDACFQLGMRDSQHRISGSQAEAQSGAMIWPLAARSRHGSFS